MVLLITGGCQRSTSLLQVIFASLCEAHEACHCALMCPVVQRDHGFAMR